MMTFVESDGSPSALDSARRITRLGVTAAGVYAQRARDVQAARAKLPPWLQPPAATPPTETVNDDAERGA